MTDTFKFSMPLYTKWDIPYRPPLATVSIRLPRPITTWGVIPTTLDLIKLGLTPWDLSEPWMPKFTLADLHTLAFPETLNNSPWTPLTNLYLDKFQPLKPPTKASQVEILAMRETPSPKPSTSILILMDKSYIPLEPMPPRSPCLLYQLPASLLDSEESIPPTPSSSRPLY